MASQIDNLNIVNGQEIALPFEVTGTCTVTGPATQLVAAARQIDDQPTQDLGPGCTPPLASASTDFAFELTSDDCPNADTYYLLTLMFWDNGAVPSMTQTSVTFKTPAASMVKGR